MWLQLKELTKSIGFGAFHRSYLFFFQVAVYFIKEKYFSLYLLWEFVVIIFLKESDSPLENLLVMDVFEYLFDEIVKCMGGS